MTPPHVEAVVEGGDWAALGDPQAVAELAAAAVFAELGVDGACYEIAVLFADDDAVAALNARFRDRAQPTNVLSWPTFPLAPGPDGAPPPPPAAEPGGGPAALGDIALAAGVVAREAQTRNLVLVDHATHLIMHGCLHLLGYDHGTERQAELMEGIERRALARIGVADPC